MIADAKEISVACHLIPRPMTRCFHRAICVFSLTKNFGSEAMHDLFPEAYGNQFHMTNFQSFAQFSEFPGCRSTCYLVIGVFRRPFLFFLNSNDSIIFLGQPKVHFNIYDLWQKNQNLTFASPPREIFSIFFNF